MKLEQLLWIQCGGSVQSHMVDEESKAQRGDFSKVTWKEQYKKWGWSKEKVVAWMDRSWQHLERKCDYFRTGAWETRVSISWNRKDGGLSGRPGPNKNTRRLDWVNVRRLDFYPKCNGEPMKNFTKKSNMTKLRFGSIIAMEHTG